MAPRRQPTPSNTAIRTTENDPEGNAETTAARHTRLRAALQERRQLQEIEEMERELAGDPPASSVLETSSISKRPASQELTMRHRRAFSPPTYRATSVRELRDFLLGCDVYFGAVEEHHDSRRIAIAASYLRDEALRQWSRLPIRPTEWSQFERALRDMVQDPANRMADASLKLKNLRQENLSVRQLVSAIEDLEDEVPDLTVEEQKAWILINCLRPDLRSAVLRESPEIRTRVQIQGLAQRLAEVGQQTEKTNPTEATSIRGASEARTERKREKSAGNKACYRCGKEGHIAKYCTEQK
ncbi:hypothetical protein ABEF95_000260 [Exophiala dermatitidis]